MLLPEEKFDPLGMIGILLGLVGVTIIVGLDSISTTGNATIFGVTLVGGAAVAAAFGSVLLSRTERSISGIGMTAWALVLAAGLVHCLSMLMGESLGDVTLTVGALIAVFWVGVPATAIAFPAYYGLIDRAGPVRANLISYTVPLVATGVGAVVLGEVVPVRTVFGFAVIVIGFALIERQNLRDEIRRQRGLPDSSDQDEEHICESAPRG
ncbi:DMT family transporter [Haladaptatus pallidirubidus]|uniref:DMT family transporter n=1 Tax=Haladaptatus pallidirubidus TaxID=1008152 RepID=UPI0035E7F33A